MKITREEKVEKLKQISKPVKENSKRVEIAKWNEEHADSIEDYFIISTRIQNALKNRGMSLLELRTKLNMEYQTFTRLINGSHNLSINEVRQIEKHLNISILSTIKN